MDGTFLNKAMNNKVLHYGLDIGGTKIEIAQFDQQFNRISSSRITTPTEDYEAFLNSITRLVSDADQKTNQRGSVGIGLPGVLSQQTGTLLSSNIPCANGMPLQKDLTEKLQRPIAIENDCRAFAFSESNGGAADSFPLVFGAILGTGAGGGFCQNGEIYRGAKSVSGEWGHAPLSARIQQCYQLPIWDCGCGLSGCYERYIAGPGIARLYRYFGGAELAAPEIVSQYRSGEETARKTFTAFLDITAEALANVIITFDPDAIVLGGGLSEVKELYEQLPDRMASYLFKGLKPPVILSPEFGGSSGVRGAAILGSKL